MDLQPKLTGAGKLNCPTLFVSLTHSHLPGMDSSEGPMGGRHVFYFDGTRGPNARTSTFWCLLSAI